MVESILYTLLETNIIRKWCEEFERENNCYKKEVESEKAMLLAVLREKDPTLINAYSLALQNYSEALYRNLAVKCLHLGIQIGLELQKSFKED